MKLLLQKQYENEKEKKLLLPYIEHCKQVVETTDYNSAEASLCLPSDEKIIASVQVMVQMKKTSNLKYVIVIGIGGSNLGTKAVYDALYGDVDILAPDRFPKMIFLDTTDPEFLHSFILFFQNNISSPEELIVAVISKSGGTTEIIANTEIVFGEMKRKFPTWKERVVIISDENSPLWKESQRLGISMLSIPKNVGGRYSVLSAVGLFPLGAVGIDIRSLLQGAKDMRQLCLTASDENPSLESSIFQYIHWKANRTTHNSYFFHKEFESLGKWYRQLTGESLGKDKKGITPILSIGSVDHHSMVQLYWGGIDDKTTEFIYTKKSVSQIVPQEKQLPSLNVVAGKETSEIMMAIIQGTARAYQNVKRPYFEVELEDVSSYEMGAYMQYKMMETLYIAQLFGINAFDQPQVELYKIETKKILEKK